MFKFISDQKAVRCYRPILSVLDCVVGIAKDSVSNLPNTCICIFLFQQLDKIGMVNVLALCAMMVNVLALFI